MPRLALAFDVAANDKASRTLERIGDKAERTGKRVNRAFGGVTGVAGKLTALAGVGGVGAVIGSSVKLAATFETTMRQVAVATNEPAGKLKELNALALKMGADTTFSAQDAGNAMLELAKGGMTAAQIKGGALASTLTLASAGGLELGNAASYVVQGLSLFARTGATAADVAAALAGGANASTASVEEMGLALSQVGPGAANAGLNLQETTGVLAAFAQNGIRGSDAGTSLKTMLTRLVPSTDKAASAMEALGLSFVDSEGNIDDITVVAEKLRKRLGKLSEAERTTALATIFGSDATRAATVLMREGSAGLAKYIKATSDKTQAEKLAKAATEGTGGALEQMRGSIETAQIALGTALAPAVVDVANKVSAFASGPLTQDIIPAVGSFVKGMQDGTGPGGKFADVVGELGDAAGSAWSAAKPLFSFIGDHPKLFGEVAKDAVIFAGAMKALSLVRGIRGGVTGVVGSAVGKTPIPVLVTNPGFGVGGGGSGTPPIATTNGRSGPANTRFGRIAASGLTVNALTVLDSVLVPKALDAGFNKLPELLKVDAQRRELEHLYAQYERFDAKTRKILDGHMADVQSAFVEASKGNFEALRDVYDDVLLDYQTGLTEAERKARSDAAAKVMPEVIRNLGKAGAAGSDSFHKPMIAGAKRTGSQFSNDLTSLIAGGMNRVSGMTATPKISTAGMTAATSKANEIFRRLERLDGATFTPQLALDVSSFQTSLRAAERQAGIGGSATGGWITGPGTSTSDSILRRLSNGEFVVNARDAKRTAPVLEAINNGQTPVLAQLGGGPSRYYELHVHEAGRTAVEFLPRVLAEAEYLLGS